MTQNLIPQTLSLGDVSAGMSLAEAVVGPQGEVVLSQGTALTEVLLLALYRRGISSLTVLGHGVGPSGKANISIDVTAKLHRLERLFRQDANQSGTAHLRALVSQYRMGATP